MSEPDTHRMDSTHRLSRLALKLGLVVATAMAALALVSTYVFSGRLRDAYQQAGREQLHGLAVTVDEGFRLKMLGDPERLQRRIARLQERNEALHKISFSWHGEAGADWIVQDGHTHDPDGVKRDIVTSKAISRDGQRTPIDEGPHPYREVDAADGAHYAEINYPLVRRGETVAVLELHYDLKALDEALARNNRTVAVTAGAAWLLLTVLANLMLRRALIAPLGRLRQATRRLRAGDRAHRLDWKRRDEIGLLAEDFDRMAEELEEVHRHLEALALTDPLTGLLNHRAFKERLEQELRRAEREKYTVSVVALDVDNFKEINDRWGHAAGDEGLRQLARAFQVHLRPSDICGRVGGDEFCLALVRATAAETEEVVDRLRQHTSRLEVGPAGQTLTISAGIAEFPTHSLAREELLHLADGAMYWAKSAGRNRTCVYSADRGLALSADELAEQATHDGLVNTVHALAKAVDAKDGYTNEHSQRVGRYAAIVARHLGFDEEAVERIRTAGVLHDVGKIGISDDILQKPDRLTEEEWDVMRRHSELGRDIIAGAGMDDIANAVLKLHERWDGKGYPHGLAGEEIPLEARILHTADALEAMTSSRVYRQGMPVDAALREIERCRGTQLDPAVADAVLELVRSGRLEIENENAGGAPLRAEDVPGQS